MKRYGKARTAQLKAEARITANDRAELAKFQDFLKQGKLSVPELVEAYGYEYVNVYLGFTHEELARIGVTPAIAV